MSTPNPTFPGASPGFSVLSQQPATHWITTQVGAPTQQYIETDSTIAVNAWCALANQTLQVTLRYLRAADGVLVTAQDRIALNSDGSLAFRTIPVVEGFLLGVNLNLIAATSAAAAFVTVQLTKYKGGSNLLETPLLSDYVGKNMPLAWPGSRITRSREGPGRTVISNPASPAAGADVSITTGLGEFISLQYLDMTFTTAVAAANRTVVVTLGQGGTELARIAIPGNIPASQVVTVSLYQGAGSAAINNNVVTMPIPSNSPIATSGATAVTIKTITTNIQAADQWLVNNMQTENWLQAM